MYVMHSGPGSFRSRKNSGRNSFTQEDQNPSTLLRKNGLLSKKFGLERPWFRMARGFYRSLLSNKLFGLCLGLVFGFMIVPFMYQARLPRKCHPLTLPTAQSLMTEPLVAADSHRALKDRKFLFVGVMTARKFVSTRCVAAYRTWAKTVPGKVMFFTSEGTPVPDDDPDVPIVALPGVDDSYPPQKKSFLMFKYMHDRFGDKFEWFMRADDDVYVKGDLLSDFLLSINSSKPQFIGQAGTGTKEEFGMLGLDPQDNFCMGGPGIVMSQATLKLIAPHISYCLKNLYTTHEDVEIGRCVKRFAGVSCTWAFEMQFLFYQNHYEPQGAYTHNLKLKEVHRAITLHPFKNHTYLFRMHHYLLSQKTFQYRHQLINLRRQITTMNNLLDDVQSTVDNLGLPPSLLKYRPRKRAHVQRWLALNYRQINSDANFNPRRGTDAPYKIALDDITMQSMKLINKNTRQKGRTIDFKEILYGYHRVNPMFGADYIMDLLLVYRKHEGRRMTVPVRRHAYIQQTFSEIEFREEPLPLTPPSQTTLFRNPIINFVKQGFKQLYSPSSNDQKRVDKNFNDLLNATIHFILPLAGRFQTFLHFMHNFEEVCLKTNEQVSFALMLFRSESEDRSEETVEYLRNLQKQYPDHTIQVIQLPGMFSRGIGLMEGAKLFSPSALLFFVDVDIYISQQSLKRMRTNALEGKQVYFPIVFSQYDPLTLCNDGNRCPKRTSPFQYDADYGYWRQFGFGIAVLYKSDLMRVGGFDTNIIGWGMEDVDLYTRFVNASYSIFRSVDLGMVHIFHSIQCDPKLEQHQYQMCLGSRVSTYGSMSRMSHIVYNTPQILNKGDQTEEYGAEFIGDMAVDTGEADQALAGQERQLEQV